MEFDKYFIVALNLDEDGKLIKDSLHIEQRFNPDDADACGGWLRNQGYDRVFTYGGTPLRWAGERGKFDIYEG